MKKQDSWTSTFRKERFYAKQDYKKAKKWVNNSVIFESELTESDVKELEVSELPREKRNHFHSVPIEICIKEIESLIDSDLDSEASSLELSNQDEEVDLLRESPEKKGQKSIAVMLDLDGTCDGICDETAEVFVNQLEILRQKFDASYATISISTHGRYPDKIKQVLDVIASHLTSNIEIALSFYYGGIYAYNQDMNIPKGFGFNSNKEKTFASYYIDDCDNQWFAIIDDGISEDVYKQYQDKQPMLLCRPSQDERDISRNNFMRIDTTTNGFDGVIEGLNTYIDSIQDLKPYQILEYQKNMMTHLSGHEVSKKVRNRNYEFIERYLKEGYADEDDYRDIITWLRFADFWLGNESLSPYPTDNELVHIHHILELSTCHFEKQDQQEDLAQVKQLQKSFSLIKIK